MRPRSAQIVQQMRLSVQRMNDSAMAADHEAYARAALTAYGLPQSARARLISLSENATFLVETDRPVGVLRLYRVGYQSETTIRSELACIEALRTASAIRSPATPSNSRNAT